MITTEGKKVIDLLDSSLTLEPIVAVSAGRVELYCLDPASIFLLKSFIEIDTEEDSEFVFSVNVPELVKKLKTVKKLELLSMKLIDNKLHVTAKGKGKVVEYSAMVYNAQDTRPQVNTIIEKSFGGESFSVPIDDFKDAVNSVDDTILLKTEGNQLSVIQEDTSNAYKTILTLDNEFSVVSATFKQKFVKQALNAFKSVEDINLILEDNHPLRIYWEGIDKVGVYYLQAPMIKGGF